MIDLRAEGSRDRRHACQCGGAELGRPLAAWEFHEAKEGVTT